VPAAIIGVYVVAGVVAMVWLRPRRPGARPWADMTAGLGRILLAALLIAYPIMLAFCPWATVKPLVNPFVALRMFADLPTSGRSELVFGVLYAKEAMPRFYLPAYFGVTLPEIALLGLVLAIGLAVAGLRRAARGPGRERLVLIGVVALSAL